MRREARNVIMQSWLVNSALGVVMQIIYTFGSIPPKLPPYVVVTLDNYIGPPWDQYQPKHISIPPINWSNENQIPLKMAWELTIHKSQGLALTMSTIDIGNNEQQCLTFTAIPCTTTLKGMWIASSFSFKCYAKMKDISYLSLERKEETHLRSLSLYIILYWLY